MTSIICCGRIFSSPTWSVMVIRNFICMITTRAKQFFYTTIA